MVNNVVKMTIGMVYLVGKLIVSLMNTSEAEVELTAAQQIAEEKLIAEIEDENKFSDNDYLIAITWIDEDTGIVEVSLETEDNSFGMSGTFDIDENGQYEKVHATNAYLNDEIYDESNLYMWFFEVETLL